MAAIQRPVITFIFSLSIAACSSSSSDSAIPGTAGSGGKSNAAGVDADSAPIVDAAPPPQGSVPMFVVSGQLGRTVTSCDDGLTWKANDFPVTTNDEFNEKGLAFGHGVFMRLMGWGAECSFMRSENGVTWQRITLAQAGLPNLNDCGGIIYNGDGFTMVQWTGDTFASDHDGLVWKKISHVDNKNEHVREVVGDGPAPGVVLAGGANDPSGMPKNPPHVSVDGGKTWKATAGCSTFNALSLGQNGGGAFGGGRMVIVGFKGQVCTSVDMVQWQESQLPGVAGYIQGKVSYDGEQFWVADNSRVFASTNGIGWTERKLPDNVRIHAVAKSNQGTWVAFNRETSAFYRSTDGLMWNAVKGPVNGPDLHRIVFGYGKPSAQCPAK